MGPLSTVQHTLLFDLLDLLHKEDDLRPLHYTVCGNKGGRKYKRELIKAIVEEEDNVKALVERKQVRTDDLNHVVERYTGRKKGNQAEAQRAFCALFEKSGFKGPRLQDKYEFPSVSDIERASSAIPTKAFLIKAFPMEDLRGFCRDPSVEDARVADTLIADKFSMKEFMLPDLVRGCMLLEIPFDRDMARHREWSHDELEERIEDALRVVVMERGFSTPYAGGKKKDPVECIDLTFEDIAGGKRKRTAGDNESKVLRVFLSKLTNGLRLGMDEEKKSKQVKKQSKKQDGGFCTTAQFRRRLTKAGLRLLPDQDVLHIIASSNGGADHVDNYHWLGNRVLDIQMGNKTDHIYCYLAGQVMARAAVKISKKHGNRTGMKYQGDDADKLHIKGEEVFRRAAADARDKKRQNLGAA